MALPAGRKGVLASEVTPEGKIRNGSYVLPVATSTTLGGVKPVAKTEAMTKEVGVDETGKLYVEPSQGGGAESGLATLASGVSGYVHYLKIDGLCFITGEVTGISANAYSVVDLCTGLPIDGDDDITVATVFASTSGASGGSQLPANIVVGKTKASINVRYVGMSSDVTYTFSGVYLVEDTRNTLTLTGCIAASVASILTTDDYACVMGNFQPTSISLNDTQTIASNLPKIEVPVFTSFIADNVKTVNSQNIYIDGTDLKYNCKTSGNTRVDGCLIYKIDKGE